MMRSSVLYLFALLSSGSFALQTKVNTYGANCSTGNGYAEVAVISGVPPYTYAWSSGGSDAEEYGLPPGWHSVTVTDNAGGSTTTPFEIFSPSAPPTGQNVIGTWIFFPGLEPCQGQCNGGFRFYLPRIAGGYSFSTSPSLTVQQQENPNGDVVESITRYEFLGGCPGQQVSLTISNDCGEGEVVVTIPAAVPDPVVSITQITGSCTGSSNGSVSGTIAITGDPFLYGWTMHAVNDQGAAVPSQPVTYNGSGGPGFPFSILGLLPGEWNLRFRSLEGDGSLQAPCVVDFPITIPSLGSDCGALTGRAFVDPNGNCIQNAGEPNLPGIVVVAQPGDHYALTNAIGQYNMNLPAGTYTVNTTTPTYTVPCATATDPFTLNAGQTLVRNLPHTSLVGLDMQVSAASGAARPGFPMVMNVRLRNLTGVVAGNGTVTVNFDPTLTYQSATPAPLSVSGNTITWSSPNIGALQERSFTVTFQVPADPGLLGTVLTTTITGSVTNPEAELANNTYIHQVTVTGAYDPNDKTALTSTRQSTDLYLLGEDQWVDYTIRFQNTGTDTAFLVVITDTLPNTLDPGSFQMGTASHAYTVSLTGQGVLRWNFANIQLPDSNVNEPLSHGFISFRIKPRGTLSSGNAITNIANIYFDFNPPVITEPSVLNVVSPIRLDARAWLGGAYDALAALMRDDLRTQSLIPVTEPYTALGYLHSGSGGGESFSPALLSTTGPTAIVDWVLLELRSTATPSTVLHSRAALVRRDGRITDKDGISPVAFAAPAGSYRIALLHRNHLGVISAAPIALGSSATTWDIRTTATALFGTTPTSVNGSTRLLWPGDGNGNGVVKYTGASNDRDPILSTIGGSVPTSVITGVYSPLDINLDGQLRYTGNGNDRDIILQTVGGSVPTAVRVEQVP